MTPRAVIALVLALSPVVAASGDGGDAARLDGRVALDIAIARADAGELTDATRDFATLRRDRDSAVARAATFDFARARFIRAVRRPLPTMRAGRPKSAAIADARAQIAVARDEFLEARAALLELLAAEPDERELLAPSAAVAERLRDLEALDRTWAEAAEALATPKGGGARGPLKPGPSGRKAESGAPGSRGGAGSHEGEAAAPKEGALPGGNDGMTLPSVDALRAEVAKVRAEAAEAEARRAAAALKKEGARRQ